LKKAKKSPNNQKFRPIWSPCGQDKDSGEWARHKRPDSLSSLFLHRDKNRRRQNKLLFCSIFFLLSAVFCGHQNFVFLCFLKSRISIRDHGNKLKRAADKKVT
jgi:hypothetical protein